MIDILATIPHRPPFLFIDEITAIDETMVTAVRTIKMEEPQFQGHYPGNPIMPGVLLCEACFQCGAVLLVNRLQKEGGSAENLTPVLSRINEAKFKHMIRPGDVITITVKFKETMSKFHFLSGKITTGSNLVLQCDFALALI